LNNWLTHHRFINLGRAASLRLWSVAACVVLVGLNGCNSGSVPEIVPKWQIKPGKQAEFAQDDWPSWRNGSRGGVAEGPAAPTKWNDKENIIWSVEVPGRGHSSPVVVGSQIFLTTADEKLRTQSVVCFQRKSGNMTWITRVHGGGLESNVHSKNSQATPTVVCDTERVFALFAFDSRVQLTALDLNGKILWTKTVGPYQSKFGYSSSPLLYGPLIIVSVDHSGGGYLAGVNRYTGDIYWRTAQPKMGSYGTPAIHKVAGKDTLFVAGGNELAAYEPLTGKRLWGIKGLSEECVGSPVEMNQTIIASSGPQGRETIAVKIMENSQPVQKWRSSMSSYVPSLLVHDGLLFQVTDSGTGSCWDVETGKMYWETRLGGEFSSSPVLSGDHIFVSNEAGVTQVFKASKEKFQLVSRNPLGDEQMASPAICGGRVYIRAASSAGGSRSERLYCIGEGVTDQVSGSPVPEMESEDLTEKIENPKAEQGGKAEEQAPK